MTRDILIGAGGPMVAAVLGHLRGLPGLGDRIGVHYVGRTATVPPDLDLPARCRLVIEETRPAEGRAGSAPEQLALPPLDCPTITIPQLWFTSLWPLHVADPALPGGVGDRLAQAIAASEPDPTQRRTRYAATPIGVIADVARHHEAQIQLGFRREIGCDIRIAATVAAGMRTTRLLSAPDHPTGALLLVILAQLHGQPALRGLVGGTYDEAISAARRFCDEWDRNSARQLPIHPGVATDLDIAWWHRDLRYRWAGGLVTFNEWIGTCLAARPVPRPQHAEPAASDPGASTASPVAQVGPGLDALHAAGALPGAIVLHAAGEQHRAVPFFATPIDPTVARNGRIMLSVASAHYRSPATLLAMLPGAIVMGRTGAVLYQGQVIADTVASGPPGGSIDLPGGMAPAGIAVGRYFCGYAGDASDTATWFTQGLPRLVAYARLRQRQPDLRLILPRRANNDLARATTTLLGVPADDIVMLGPDETLAVEKLLVAGPFDGTDLAPFTREAAMALAGQVPLSPPGPERLFVHSVSGATAPLRNGGSVAALLRRCGFTVLDLDTLELADGIAVMRHARVVVGEQGAALAYTLFCPTGARVLELAGPADPSLTYWSFASCAGLDYGYLIGQTEVPKPAGGSPFSVNLEILASAVAAMLAPAL